MARKGLRTSRILYHFRVLKKWSDRLGLGPRALEALGSCGVSCFKEAKDYRIFFFSMLFLFFWGCNYGRMYDQESVRTYETPIPEMPEGTIPISGGTEPLKKTAAKGLRNPLPRNPESLEQGKGVYKYFCIQCHGPLADGNGTVGQSFAPLPANLKEKAVQRQTDGELFVKISLGYRRHPPLASTVSEEDRWAVVHFMRGLKTAK
jgi:mono/diheme cytochrome c family protein